MEEKYKQQPANCLKVVLFGPESTGKTTLSKALAEYYETVWVPEYARAYLQDKWDREKKTCEPEDLLPIAAGQIKLENSLAQQANSVLICDTDLLETKVYSEAYYLGSCDPILEKYALENRYDLYFLTYIDTPWEADDLRDKPHERECMFNAFQGELDKQNRPYVILKGSFEERLKEGIFYIDGLLKNRLMFSEKDIEQIKGKGIALDQVERQITRLKNGMSFSNLIAAAKLDKGIERYDDTEMEALMHLYEGKQNDLDIVKFVPASGAATRMFKFLFQFLQSFRPNKESLTNYAERKNDTLIGPFFKDIEKLPFYDEVIKKIRESEVIFDALSPEEQFMVFVQTMLDEKALNYSFLPKGLLPFHKYGIEVKTAFLEHLYEATLYAASNQKANLHFTISKKHHSYFEKELERMQEQLEDATNTKFNVSFSYQKESTETVALAEHDKLFRNDDGSILFRPAGHGALLENLNSLDFDIIFIKNIDNIVVSTLNQNVSNYKKLLVGVLIEVQEKVFNYLNILDGGNLSEADIKMMALFLRYRLNVLIDSDFESFPLVKKQDYLKDKLNRPIRVCGMVKNQGEPGGGPFWVRDKNDNISLQIVEFAQIDFSRRDQQEIVYKASHFNPTDLVCGVRNYKGEKFDLMAYVDHEAAFITTKTQNGVDIKALELPGLWNGSMAYWNSVFVEVPVETFNPVKTVNDLLKPVHQVSND